jgi:hypothetical protein
MAYTYLIDSNIANYARKVCTPDLALSISRLRSRVLIWIGVAPLEISLPII